MLKKLKAIPDGSYVLPSGLCEFIRKHVDISNKSFLIVNDCISYNPFAESPIFTVCPNIKQKGVNTCKQDLKDLEHATCIQTIYTLQER